MEWAATRVLGPNAALHLALTIPSHSRGIAFSTIDMADRLAVRLSWQYPALLDSVPSMVVVFRVGKSVRFARSTPPRGFHRRATTNKIKDSRVLDFGTSRNRGYSADGI